MILITDTAIIIKSQYKMFKDGITMIGVCRDSYNKLLHVYEQIIAKLYLPKYSPSGPQPDTLLRFVLSIFSLDLVKNSVKGS